jgi:hypothetical protein
MSVIARKQKIKTIIKWCSDLLLSSFFNTENLVKVTRKEKYHTGLSHAWETGGKPADQALNVILENINNLFSQSFIEPLE